MIWKELLAGQHAMNGNLARSSNFVKAFRVKVDETGGYVLYLVTCTKYVLDSQLVSDYLQLKEKSDANWQKSLLLYFCTGCLPRRATMPAAPRQPCI